MNFFIRLKDIFRLSVVYAFGRVLNQAIPFLLLPILTRYLSPSDYGIIFNFEAISILCLSFIGLNLSGAVSRNFYDFDKDELSQYIGACIVLSSLSLFLCCFIIYPFRSIIFKLSAIPSDWLFLVLLNAFGLHLSSIALALWQVKRKAVSYSFHLLCRNISNIGLSLILVIGFSMMWQGRLLAISISSIVFGFYAFTSLTISNHIKLSRLKSKYFIDALKFGVPLIAHHIGAWLISMIGRFVLSYKVGVDENGLYAVGFQIGGIFGVMQVAFNLAWVPWFYEKLKTGRLNYKIFIVKFTYLYFAISVLAALFLSTAAPFILSFLVGPKFTMASKYVAWVSFGFAFNGMYMMVVNYLFYEKKTYLISLLTITSGAINTVITMLLIHKNGAVGAAQAFCFTFIILFILTWIVSSSIHKMPWSLKNLMS